MKCILGGTGLFDRYISSRLSSANVKIKYQAYKNDRLFVAPYVGMSINKNTFHRSDRDDGSYYGNYDYTRSTDRKTSILIGATTVYALDKGGRFKTYFDGAIGNKVYSWNVGLSCEIVKNLDFDFGYKYYQAKMNYSYASFSGTSSGGIGTVTPADHGTIKSKSKGIYFGLSYKFK